jgi:hypothetical protein
MENLSTDGVSSINARSAPALGVIPNSAAAPLGVLMLATRFPRPPGDVGNPATWRRDTLFRVVQSAGPRDVVRDAAALAQGPVFEAFAQAARELQAHGVGAITTSCGFLVLLQGRLQAVVNVPLVSSSLVLLPWLLDTESRVGVLTIASEHLADAHLRGAGVSPGRLRDVVVQGVAPGGEFAQAILGNREQMDIERAGRDVVDAAVALHRRAPDVRTLVLECTNMPPHAQAVRDATGLRVLSLADVPVLRGYAAR